MRLAALPTALGILALSTGTAFASAGLPKIASVQVGTYQANIYNSSPGARTGPNTLTVEVPGLPAGSTVALSFTGPAGELVTVPLKPLQAASAAESGADPHGGHGAAEAAADSHAEHGAAPAEAHSEHGAGLDASAFLVRGTANLTAPGEWGGLLEILAPHSEMRAARFQVTAQQSGPNQLFLSSTGLLMGGSMLYGFIRRQRGGK